MPAVIHNATIITPVGGPDFRADVRVLREHSLVFDAGQVQQLAPAARIQTDVDARRFSPVIDGRNRIVIPGLINTHHHLYQSLTRCLPAVQNAQLFRWLLGLYERWRGVDHDAIQAAAKVSLCELLLHGCTTTSDHFYLLPRNSGVRMEAVLSAADELGVRIHLGRGSMTLGQSRGGLPPDELTEDDADVLADYQRVLDAYHDPRPHAMQRIDLAPCSPFNVTTNLLRETVQLARQRGVLLHTHLAETLDEERFCLARFGCRPVQYLADLGWLGSDVYLAHCVHLSDEEIRLFAQTRTGVSHCPTSNMRLGSGIAPVRKLLEAGVRVGLAVDGSSSNDGGDLLGEVKLAALVARLGMALDAPGSDAPLWPAAEAFKLATVGGAAVLHRPELGHLNPGAAADFAIFRADDIGLAGAAAQDPLAALVLCAPPRAEQVFVAGRQVVREGRIAALDEYALAARLNELVARRFAV